MKNRLFNFAVACLLALGVNAQPFPVQQPGKLLALPQLHQNSLNQPAKRLVAAKPHQPQVTLTTPLSAQKALRRIADADASLFEGRTVYGAMVNSDRWANMGITEVPYGIHSFKMGSSEAPVAHLTDMIYNFMSGAWGRDRHYGIVPLNVLGTVNGARYITLNTRDWVEEKNVMWSTEYGTYSLIASTMAYDPTSDEFYGFQYKEDLSGLNWVKLNQQTDRMEQVAQYRGKTAVLTLAATPDGQMYYIDADGDLYTVNKQNGRGSLVGNTGVTPSAYNQAMVFDGKTGTFLWAAQGNEGSVLYSVDPATAEAKRVMRFQHNEQFVSLYITDTEAPSAAPAAVGRPQLKAESNGSLKGKITFTVPSRTFGGETLSGNVNLNVWLDGENLKGEEVAAGTSMTIPVETTEGNHYIAITTDNGAGFSPLRYIYQYMGYDTPVAVSSVTFELQDDLNVISWKAPTTGVNAGYIDAAGMTYDIVRMPDSVTVATGLTTLSYSEPTPNAMHSYSYRVIANNHEHRSQYTESNRILCGKSFTVPYNQLFEDPTTLKEYFTIVDNDGDGNTWRQGYTTEVRMDYMKQNDADDWLISPPIQMEKGMKYRFAMNMKIFTKNYPEDFEILIGTDATDLSTFKLLKREEGFTEIASEYADYTTDFLVDESADYRMAVRYCSKKNSAASLMMIHNFAVTAIGNSGAPAQPADFTITPDADGALKTTVSMKAPALNLMDETITTLTAINLYRDGGTEPIHTFNAPQPGEQLSFTDEQVPSVGLHTYSAVAYSEAGTGEPVSAEQFIGIYTAPYSEDFEDRRYANLWTTEADFTDDNNGWYGWKWTDNDNTYGRFMSLYYYLMSDTPTTIWLYSPKLKMEDDAVYTINFDAQMNYSAYPDMTFDLYQGTEASADGMNTLVANLPSTDYTLTTKELLLVNNKAGKYYLGIKAYGEKKADYFNVSLDNFKLTYRTSAFAPYQMTNYTAVADPTAELKATLAFDVPAVNYYQQALDASKNLTVKIYRGQNATMPVETLSVKPGEHVSWTDGQALHGLNYYTVTCENEFGRGETLRDTIFVGRDVPALVENFVVRGSADNKDAVITWNIPSEGANGGVVLKDETTYSVYDYNPQTGELKLIAEKINTTSYTVERPQQTEQQMCYYAVTASNTEGEGAAIAASIVLGQLYSLPFKESFAGGTISTQLWQAIPMVQGATSCGLDNPNGSYNQCTAAQDNDGGCVYFYNGYQYETPAGALLVTPKVKLSASTGNELHFWAYHFKEVYSSPAFIQVAISGNDSQFANISNAQFEIGESIEAGWKEHVVNLDRYRNADFVSVALMGITNGYQDVIYADNISIINTSDTGVNDVRSTGSTAAQDCFDLQGRKVNPAKYHGVVVRNGKKMVLR
ncbi:choice-of-anchor J domain-containing protein [Prevotella sp. E9-3]|uniref:choice-of-anchor J domain-containing protein n=1 Tax=Prevotella sp. E9-3 TaxID=2913621 RepID=UPI001EDA9CF4|nr:choice-of-anchor J domain-containing protein [Prevotella sp. E9-3]UKK48653.1 choice-of-anchor J domain-containing protein [Prevotella sp. E9-3]